MVSDQLRGRQLSDRVNDMGFRPGAPRRSPPVSFSLLSPTADNPHWIIACHISHRPNRQRELSVKTLSTYISQRVPLKDKCSHFLENGGTATPERQMTSLIGREHLRARHGPSLRWDQCGVFIQLL